MRTFLYHFVIILLLFPQLLAAQDDTSFKPSQPAYLWPTNASHHLTSTFAETRTGHFHAALDLKTWGRRNYEVYATRSGIVYRMAVGPTGYGKVLYLKHKDGSISLYAHLMRFNKKLQAFADSLRFAEDHRPSFDRVIADQKIRIARGEIIGYSGASGIGPPHLHFELRTPSGRPFNPLLTNMTVRDHIAPDISGLSVEPLGPHSIIEGEKQIYTRTPNYSDGTYRFGTIEVAGPVGLGIDAFDQSNGVSNVYAVYELSMSVDGRQRFYSRVDSFAYRKTNQIFIDRAYPLLRKYGQGYQRLFVADGNTLSFYAPNTDGKLQLSPGRHTVTITATDFFGNSTRATATLLVKNYTPRRITASPTVLSPNKLPDIDIDRWHWFHNWVDIPKEDYRALTVAIPDPWLLTSYNNNVTLDLRVRDNLFMNIPGKGPTIFHRMIPAQKGFITSIDRRAMASFPKHTFYDTVSVALSSTQYKPDSVKVTVGPEAYPLDKNYRFYVKRDSTLKDTSNLSFYKYNKQYDNWYLTDTRFTDQYIIGSSISLGTFITRRDSIPPELEQPELSRRPDGQWLIFVGIDDDLSGIASKRTKMWVNGRQGLAEYEPEDDRLVYYHPGFLPTSTMNVRVVAYDRMGNRIERQFRLGR